VVNLFEKMPQKKKKTYLAKKIDFSGTFFFHPGRISASTLQK
jgi:hypothetical protein